MIPLVGGERGRPPSFPSCSRGSVGTYQRRAPPPKPWPAVGFDGPATGHETREMAGSVREAIVMRRTSVSSLSKERARPEVVESSRP